MTGFNPSPITTLTFDCYGTLIDYEAGTIEALRPLLDRSNVKLSDGDIIAAARTSRRHFVGRHTGVTRTL